MEGCIVVRCSRMEGCLEPHGSDSLAGSGDDLSSGAAVVVS